MLPGWRRWYHWRWSLKNIPKTLFSSCRGIALLVTSCERTYLDIEMSPLGARLADQLPFLPVLKLLLCLDLSCFVAIFDWFSSVFPSATTGFSHNSDQSNHQLDNWNMSKAPVYLLVKWSVTRLAYRSFIATEKSKLKGQFINFIAINLHERT